MPDLQPEASRPIFTQYGQYGPDTGQHRTARNGRPGKLLERFMTPEIRNDAESLAQRRPDNPDAAAAKRASSSPIVRQQHLSGQRPVTCRVSLLVPSGRRTRWWYLATCPVCHRPHLGRARELSGVTGTRRLPCGHKVEIVVARTYGRAEPGAAA